MKVIKRFFNSSPFLPPNEAVEDYLSLIRFDSNESLPTNYQNLMEDYVEKCEFEDQFLLELIHTFEKLSEENQIMKILTIIHYFIVSKNYKKDSIASLEKIRINTFTMNSKDPWFVDFVRTYLTYFFKLFSSSDIYEFTVHKDFTTSPSNHLTHLFRLTNTVTILFPNILNAVNIVGRYQKERCENMKDLFLILSGELVRVYAYIRFLCDQILRQYRIYNPNDLKCFLQYLPEVSLLCDKIEDILVNKYIKGKKINAKIEFKEEKVSEVQYYLDYEYNNNGSQPPQETIL